MAAPASLTYRGCICTRPSGETDVGNSTLNAIEEAVDVFNRGNGSGQFWVVILAHFEVCIFTDALAHRTRLVAAKVHVIANALELKQPAASLPPWAAEWPGPELVEPWCPECLVSMPNAALRFAPKSMPGLVMSVNPQEFIVRWCRDSWKRHLLPPADNAGLQRMATLVNAIHPDHDPMYVFRIKAALVLRDPGDAEAALQGLTAYVAAHPTLAYMADIPQFRREIQQCKSQITFACYILNAVAKCTIYACKCMRFQSHTYTRTHLHLALSTHACSSVKCSRSRRHSYGCGWHDQSQSMDSKHSYILEVGISKTWLDCTNRTLKRRNCAAHWKQLGALAGYS
eukprot:1141962-Pelagomonas_calceolata.AAC.8